MSSIAMACNSQVSDLSEIGVAEVTAFDIDPKWVIEAAARRSKWID